MFEARMRDCKVGKKKTRFAVAQKGFNLKNSAKVELLRSLCIDEDVPC